jgi:hypothetical protein
MSGAGDWVRVIIGGLKVTVVGYFCIQAISGSPNASPTPTNTTSSPVRSGPPSSPSAPTYPCIPDLADSGDSGGGSPAGMRSRPQSSRQAACAVRLRLR